MPRLRRVLCTSPGLARRRHGRGFTYLDEHGRRISRAATLERIRSLAIPPAWTEVWICPDDLGHLQAVGTDAAGRRQYLYHPDWRARRDQQKFARAERFAERLPDLRSKVALDLAERGLVRERVLAGALRLLDRGLFRVGSEDYAEQNGSFGLATIRRSHVRLRGDETVFRFRAKGGARWTISVRDADLAKLLRSLLRRRGGGSELLAYREDGGWRDVRSADINERVKELAGEEFSAKDFRTWHATVMAAVLLATADPPRSRTARRRTITRVVADVADQLGNTPAVCRASYLDPRILERFEEGVTIALPRRIDLEDLEASDQQAIEGAVIELLEGSNQARTAA
jgi:DNA topoisomerase-1